MARAGRTSHESEQSSETYSPRVSCKSQDLESVYPSVCESTFNQRLPNVVNLVNVLKCQAGANLSVDEVHERLDAIQPPYARHGNCVVTLRNALAHLSVSEEVVVGSVEEGMCDSFSDGSPLELTTAMEEACGNAAKCKVVHDGMPDHCRQ